MKQNVTTSEMLPEGNFSLTEIAIAVVALAVIFTLFV